MKIEQLLRLIKACEKRHNELDRAFKALKEGGRPSISIMGAAYSTCMDIYNDQAEVVLIALRASIDTELQRHKSALQVAEDALNEWLGEPPTLPPVSPKLSKAKPERLPIGGFDDSVCPGFEEE